MCDLEKLYTQLLELSKQLANSSKSFKLTFQTKDINFTFSSQDVKHPDQDVNHAGSKTTEKKKKKSPSQKNRDSERRKLFLRKKLEQPTKSLKPSEETHTSEAAVKAVSSASTSVTNNVTKPLTPLKV